jgi:hypothetical protein
LNGFIASIEADWRSGEVFHRNGHAVGAQNYPNTGPGFGGERNTHDLYISNNCDHKDLSSQNQARKN